MLSVFLFCFVYICLSAAFLSNVLRKTSTTRQILKQSLLTLNYHIAEFLLSPVQFGIPNSRLRYYLLARRTSFLVQADDGIGRQLPGFSKHTMDVRLLFNGVEEKQRKQIEQEIHEIRKYIDTTDTVESRKGCKVPDKVLQKWGRLFDIVTPSSRRSCCFTRGCGPKWHLRFFSHDSIILGYTRLVEKAGSILQMNEDLNVSEMQCDPTHSVGNTFSPGH